MSRTQLGVLPCVRPAAFVHWTNGQCSPPTMSRWCSNLALSRPATRLRSSLSKFFVHTQSRVTSMSRTQLGVLPCVRPAAFVHWTNGQCSPPTMSRCHDDSLANQLSYAPAVYKRRIIGCQSVMSIYACLHNIARKSVTT